MLIREVEIKKENSMGEVHWTLTTVVICRVRHKYSFERIWELATNSNYLLSLQPDGETLRYFKLRLSDPTEFIVWNIEGLRDSVAKRLEN